MVGQTHSGDSVAAEPEATRAGEQVSWCNWLKQESAENTIGDMGYTCILIVVVGLWVCVFVKLMELYTLNVNYTSVKLVLKKPQRKSKVQISEKGKKKTIHICFYLHRNTARKKSIYKKFFLFRGGGIVRDGGRDLTFV